MFIFSLINEITKRRVENVIFSTKNEGYTVQFCLRDCIKQLGLILLFYAHQSTGLLPSFLPRKTCNIMSLVLSHAAINELAIIGRYYYFNNIDYFYYL